MNKNNKNFFVWVIFTFLQTLSGAENQNFSIVPDLHNDEIALRLVCRYLDDHDDISSFAETNKAYHNYMLSLANTRKKLLCADNGEHLGSIGHKYGSVYCHAYRSINENTLLLEYSALASDKQPKKAVSYFSDFIFPLSYKPAPFFNNEGKFCFYGYGSMIIEGKFISTIVQYRRLSIGTPGSDRLCCLMAKQGDEIGSRQMYRRFDFCMEYPLLLRAILNSSQVTQGSDDEELVFWLDGVTIPDNYAEKVPMKDLSENWKHNNFEHLPDIIKKFIEGS